MPPSFTSRLHTSEQCRTILNGDGAAIDSQLDAVDKARIVAGQKQRHRRDFFGSAHFPARNQRLELRFGFLVEHLFLNRRGDLPWTQHVDSNLPVFQFVEPRASESVQRGFARRIRAITRPALLLARLRAALMCAIVSR